MGSPTTKFCEPRSKGPRFGSMRTSSSSPSISTFTDVTPSYRVGCWKGRYRRAGSIGMVTARGTRATPT
eukprot:CAMPEP_0180792612 /NCGR_PEP_ID=MMETSP1038_2-20121128/54509_1 /TAXON_ID=632150 /ORGANISM="Azadinium spinosum, Strain 3D9" /LENGTH=68 /DNA_ID=CAMNT_0022830977 /DNA_START=223 /DNA_END=425 /DNA_ORIENTATION=-